MSEASPSDLKYNVEHTWIKIEGENLGRVGITRFAQDQLKKVVFIELPEVGAKVTQMQPFGVIESVKATNDLFSPVSGEVTAVNNALASDPEMVNQSPYGDGWMIVIRISDAAETDKLISAAEYDALLGGKAR